MLDYPQLPGFPVYRTDEEEFRTLQEAAIALGEVTLSSPPRNARMIGNHPPKLVAEMGKHLLDHVFFRSTMFDEISSHPPQHSPAVAEILARGPAEKPVADQPAACARAFVETVREWLDPNRQNVVLHSSGGDSRLISATLAKLRDEGIDIGSPVFVCWEPEVDASWAILDELRISGSHVSVLDNAEAIDGYADSLSFEEVGASHSEPVRFWGGGIPARIQLELLGFDDWANTTAWSGVWGDIVYRLSALRSHRTVAEMCASYFFDGGLLFPPRVCRQAFPHGSVRFLEAVLSGRLDMPKLEWKQAMLREIWPALADYERFPNARDDVARWYAEQGHHPWMELSAETTKRMAASYAASWYAKTIGPAKLEFPPVLEYQSHRMSCYIRAAICEHLIKCEVKVRPPPTMSRFVVGESSGAEQVVEHRLPRLTVITAMWGKHEHVGVVLKHLNDLREELAGKLELSVVVAGSEGAASKRLTWRYCADYVEVPNQPLGAKWNAALRQASLHQPDGVVITGSDDLLSAGLLREWAKGVHSHDVQGLADMHVANTITGDMLHWTGYPQASPRHGECAGPGRCLSARLLDDLGWHLWDDDLGSSLDLSAWRRIRSCSEYSSRVIHQRGDVGVLALKGGELITHFESYKRHGCAETPKTRDLDEAFPGDLFAAIGKLRPTYTVGVAMIVKGDETERLARAIASVRLHVRDVLCCVDTRHGNQALRVARNCGARVWSGPVPMFEDRWLDFGGFRNLSFEKLDADWVFVIDADEVLVQLGDLLEAIDQAHRANRDAVMMHVRMHGDGGHVETERSLRAFRREATTWLYPVHNIPVPAAGGRFQHVISSSAMLETSYAGQLQERAARALPVLERMWEIGGDAGWMQHAAFFLAKTALISRDLDGVRRWCEQLEGLIPDDTIRVVFWAWWIEACIRQDDFCAAKEVLARAEECGHGSYEGVAYWRAMLASTDWALSPAEETYGLSPHPTRRWLEKFNEAADLLGWPVQIRVMG